MDDLSRQLQVVAGQATGNKRDLDSLLARVNQLEKAAEKNAERLYDLRERYQKSALATEHFIKDLLRRVERLENEIVPLHIKRLSEIRTEVVRLKTLDEERARQDATGSHDLAEIRAATSENRERNGNTLKSALDNNKALIAVLASLAAIGTVLAKWLASQ